jgi:tRNA (uracil-5-)-methyltransferase TRM9
MQGLYRYNAGMNFATTSRLLALNHDFYTFFGKPFSATRQRLQPAVKRILDSLSGDESILDLGCGNGELAHELTRRGHRAQYLGVDFSLPLLRDAESPLAGTSHPKEFPATFREIDLSRLSSFVDPLSIQAGWSLITAFAVLHHIPSYEMRLDILKAIRKLMKTDGRFILSNWQFMNSEKLKLRIQPWNKVGLTDGDVDEGDYLLDWRSGGAGLRYIHHFSVQELSMLAEQAGLRVSESFLSDGENGRLGLYQVWKSG